VSSLTIRKERFQKKEYAMMKLKKCLCNNCLQTLLSLNYCTFKKPSQREARKAVKLIKKMVSKHESKMLVRRPAFYLNNKTIIAKNYFGQLIGVISIIDWGDGSIEIVSHVVHPNYQGAGLGKILFHKMKKIIRHASPKIVFLFTNQIEFYKKIGFAETNPEQFGTKIQSDCLPCRLGPNGPGHFPCPEKAMKLNENLWEKIGEIYC
ncbi:MAG: GNAT family N-acetyltransferase, partial [Candidatus Moraniibacteriota bacterium]